MSGVAIEDLLELWSAELRKAKARLGWLIGHRQAGAGVRHGRGNCSPPAGIALRPAVRRRRDQGSPA